MASFVEIRHQRLRDGICFGQDRCMEIGALVDPVLHRQDGNVFYADHLSTEDLKQQFSWDSKFDFSRLVDVDFVWDNHRPLKECVQGQFDYIVASHVGEHVPNLIGWIDQICDVLTPNGQLRLALPDGRYSFDMKRQETRLSDLLAAWMKKSHCPETHLVLDFALNKVDDQLAASMHAYQVNEFNASEFDSQFPFVEALQWGERTLDPNHYEDVHCWVLHLNLFAKLMIPLAQHDILRMACAGWYNITPPHIHEFMVYLSPEPDKAKRIASWENLYQQTKNTVSMDYSMSSQVQQLQAENLQLKEELNSVYRSSSWRITAPLRAMMMRIKNKSKT
ncbi:methyltransferase domain-containing protein [Commensalibacter oyaizuii]|uniref:Methyltransferase domain-containing protein n=1 Tax=Commensalibacter oyaizuii TaxID=3043873 RepID=A0ABT6Q4J9_9PROT|nr:methyltransferase domain-containing protein [Commensalibacter sp. TBRC 16381]MDI2091424.1 methyltransferase domain-containing protein [Commensalibacter sp. TBRC 16381]